MDQRLGFLPALLLATEAECPCRHQVLDVVLVQRVQRAVALQMTAHAVRQHAGGVGLVVRQVVLGDTGCPAGRRDRCNRSGQQKLPHRDLPIFPARES